MRKLAVLILVAVGCNNSEPSGTLKPLPAPDDPAHSTMLPDPERQGGHVGRAPRRITVAQLKASIETTTGRPWASLESRAASLGRADYALVNAEGTETNLVFAKFLEDGARDVCSATAAADLRATRAADRILARELPDSIVTNIAGPDDAAVRANLIYLTMRFWGEAVAGADLDEWTGMWKAMATRAQTINKKDQALTAICVALMTDPRFITY